MYTKPPPTGEEDLTEFLEKLDLPAIGVKQNEMLISKITEDEIEKAISQTKSGKSPGADGLGASFYKTFKKELFLYYMTHLIIASGQARSLPHGRRPSSQLFQRKVKTKNTVAIIDPYHS